MIKRCVDMVVEYRHSLKVRGHVCQQTDSPEVSLKARTKQEVEALFSPTTPGALVDVVAGEPDSVMGKVTPKGTDMAREMLKIKYPDSLCGHLNVKRIIDADAYACACCQATASGLEIRANQYRLARSDT